MCMCIIITHVSGSVSSQRIDEISILQLLECLNGARTTVFQGTSTLHKPVTVPHVSGQETQGSR